jgi:putative transposase
MWIALRREGEEVGRGRVQRLMKGAGIQGAKRRGKAWRTTKPDPLAHRRPDLVERDFSAGGPNRLWVAGLSYLRCREGNLFLSFVIDAFSRKVVGCDHGVLASVGSVGDAYDNAMAESFVDSFKTELAVVEYIAWFNNDRLHESVGDLPPAEFEGLYVAQGVN